MDFDAEDVEELDARRRVRRQTACGGRRQRRGDRRAQPRDASAIARMARTGRPCGPVEDRRRRRPARSSGERSRQERTAPPRPLPVRPSHPAGGDGRRRGSSPCGVHAAVPVLLQLRRRTARHHNDRARQRRAGRLCRRGRRTVVRSRVDPPRIPRSRERGSPLSRRPGLPRCCDRHSRRRQRAR